MMDARDTFGEKSEDYARLRPRYPAALLRWLAGQCQGHQAAWDCATGNGQAAVGLAPFFGVVHATDRSPAQIAQAMAAPNVIFSVQAAEQTSLPDHAVDLVTTAQALHWFHYPSFWPEVRSAEGGIPET
jgi:ubiquinone/menaquinone biosynthesis C-methylase UbiE